MMILAHMEMNRANKQKQMNGGKMLMRAVGMAGKEWQANKKPAEQGTAGRDSQWILRPAQASKQTASSWPALQQTQQLQTMAAGLSPCR